MVACGRKRMLDERMPMSEEMTAEAIERLMPLDEVKDKLGVGFTTTKLLVHRGELRSVKIRGRRLVHPEDLETYIRARRTTAE